MRQELYQKVYERYLEKYEEINKELETGSCRFRDIAANLLGCDVYIKIGDEKRFSQHIHALRNYFRLLEWHPEFKKAEITTLDGGFPELYAQVDTPEGRKEQKTLFEHSPARALHYVFLCNKKLENIVHSTQ